MAKPKITDWLSALRLRTLPLSLSCILMGNFMAYHHGGFDAITFSLTVLTTILLQCLSNLANDYGDSIHGADSDHRQGPQRGVQSGVISAQQMKNAMYIFALASFLSGVGLVLYALIQYIWLVVGFVLLGLLCIYAAIGYTAGKKPYGYQGLGDISVFIFFGIVGVFGAYYLQNTTLHTSVLLPSLCSGFLATAVLNINNVRDIASDQIAGKRSIPVRIGRQKAIIYHLFLLTLAFVSLLYFTVSNYEQAFQWLFLLALPLLTYNGIAMLRRKDPKEINPLLKQLSLSTLLITLLFGLGLILA